ncbi:MAG: homoserine dehydrogenase, partial [Dongia sp.]
MAAENAPAGALRVGIAGLGTVGVGVVRLLQENRDVLQQHCPRPIEVVAVSARDRRKNRDVDLSGYDWVDDPV